MSLGLFMTGGARYMACGHKLAGDNGPIVGSRAKVESAMP